MKKVNKHGLKIVGLKKAAAETTNWIKSGCYTAIYYDQTTGEVWTVDQISSDSWTEYRDPAIVNICNTETKMTMQQIADAIAATLAEI